MGLYPASGKMKSAITWEGGEMVITTPLRKAWIQTGFLLSWLVGWAAGEIFAIISLFRGFRGGEFAPSEETSGAIFLLLWVTIWTLAGSAAGYQVLIRFVGRQVMRVSDMRLAVEKRIFGIRAGKMKEYEAALISGGLTTGGSVINTVLVQSGEMPSPGSVPRGLLAKLPNLLPGMITFSFGGQPVQIEMPNDEEARWVVDQITSQYRVYAAKQETGDSWG